MDARRRKSVENGLENPPPGTKLGGQFLIFCRFCRSSFVWFFEYRFGRPSGRILFGFGEVSRELFEHSFINF